MTSPVLSAAARYVSPLIFAVSVVLLYLGHNLPGGGFIGGLTAAVAILLRDFGREDAPAGVGGMLQRPPRTDGHATREAAASGDATGNPKAGNGGVRARAGSERVVYFEKAEESGVRACVGSEGPAIDGIAENPPAEAMSRRRGGTMPYRLMVGGLALAGASAFWPVLLGKPFFTGLWLPDFSLPLLGKIHLGTPLLFDVGVYLTVIGFVVHTARCLSMDADAEPEREGAPWK